MPWNSRWMRVLVGVLLLSAAILAVLPSFTGYTSLDGTVNARFAVVSAPIEGVVSDTPPKVGTALPEDTSVFFINNGRIARTAEAQLDADLAASKEKLRALELQAKDLSALKTDLIGRLR